MMEDDECVLSSVSLKTDKMRSVMEDVSLSSSLSCLSFITDMIESVVMELYVLFSTTLGNDFQCSRCKRLCKTEL